MAAPVYDRIGVGYAEERRPDPRWAAAIDAAVGPATSVASTGAGTGSYEPAATVVAVEPSGVMITQRAPGAAPSVRGVAERLPLGDGAVDVALVVLSLHHWSSWRAGLDELRRVSRRQVVLTFDDSFHDRFWLIADYLPEIADLPLNRPPAPVVVADALGRATVTSLPVPHDMVDGVLWAGWRRPERYLDPAVLAAASSTAALPPAVLARGIARLRADLETGEWHRRHAGLLAQEAIDGGFRLIASSPD
ncbi:MAG TPA: methyltransferase domain-containing protein [Iamia sp.]